MDEIGDIPLNLQVKLLRVLQEHQIERLGSTENISIDVRIIAATHQNLEQKIKENIPRRFILQIKYYFIKHPAFTGKKRRYHSLDRILC